MSAGETTLPNGFRVDEFEIVRVLGDGGFGITYLGWDHVLDKPVAIKEYYPQDWAQRLADNSVRPTSSAQSENFDWGRDRFLDEAKTLAKFNHPNLVRAYRYFNSDELNTSFIVMDYVEGEPLESVLKREKTLSADKVRFVMERLLEGLDQVHRLHFLHRDIKPANVLLSAETGQPILIDFGAARQTVQTRTVALTAIVTPGYGPHEQYSVEGDNQGPWTDIYALCALGYRALTGFPPPEGNTRFEQDSFRPLDENAYSDPALCRAINRGLRVITRERPASAKEWCEVAECETLSLPQDDQTKAKWTQKRSTNKPVKAVKPPLLKRVPVAGITAGLLGLIVLGGGAFAGWTFFSATTESPLQPGGTPVGSTANVSRAIDTSQAAPQEYQIGDVFSDCEGCPEMIVVPDGRFQMGSASNSPGHSPSEAPVHTVSIDTPFAIGRYEVTIDEWALCVQSGGCQGYDPATQGVDTSNGRFPVTMVPYVLAQQYANWLSRQTGKTYQLPSEAEWEYAARGGTQTVFTWGNSLIRDMANCTGCVSGADPSGVVPVGSYSANGYGLYDVQGNVWEWTRDCRSENYESTPRNGSAHQDGDCTNRAVRGGSFADAPETIRPANRYFVIANQPRASNKLGFRIVRELD